LISESLELENFKDLAQKKIRSHQ